MSLPGKEMKVYFREKRDGAAEMNEEGLRWRHERGKAGRLNGQEARTS